MQIRSGLVANGLDAFGSIGFETPEQGGPMFLTLTDELLELTADAKGVGRASFATTIACCTCCCCRIVYL